MAEVLFLGGNKVRDIKDIIGTQYAAEMVLRFIDGSLEKWMLEEKSIYAKYLNSLSSIAKELNGKTITALRELFEIEATVEVISDQKKFEEALNSGTSTQYIVSKGTYFIPQTISLYRKVFLVGERKAEAIIETGYATQKSVLDNLNCVDIEIKVVQTSVDDLVVFLNNAEISTEEKLELINNVDEKEYTQDLLGIKIDCLLTLGEINEALACVEKISDDGDRLFYSFDINDRISNDRKALIEKYLKPAVEKGNTLAIQKYVLILKDGSKGQKKEAFSLLTTNSQNDAVLLNMLGDFYINGIGTKSDANKALEQYQAARQLLRAEDCEMKHSITGIANCYAALGKTEEAMEYYSMSSDCKMVRKVVKYYKDKGDVPQVISHYIKCKNLGDIEALIDLSEYLFSQGEAYKEQSLNYAIEYVRSQDGDRKKKKAILEKQMLYYDKKEKHQKDKIVCDRIEREAADNGFRITRTLCKVRDLGSKAGKVVVWAGGTVGATMISIILHDKWGKGGKA